MAWRVPHGRLRGDQHQGSAFFEHVFGELFGLVLLGALLGLAFGLAQSVNRWSIAFYALGIALASAAVGGLLGLLFGVPRSIPSTNHPAQPQLTHPAAEEAPPPQTTSPISGYAPNTNLEQVSDWLTKLLLGAGLTQIARLAPALRHLGDYLAPGLGGSGTNSFAVTLVVFNLLAGFFFGFLAARLRLGKAFMAADRLALDRREAESQAKSLPEARVDPSMLEVSQTDDPQARRAAVDLKRRVERIELATPGQAFRAGEYRRLAQELVRVKQYPQALNLLELAMRLYPHDPTLPLYAGAIYGMYLCDYTSAERNYFLALSLQPNFAPALYDLACNSARQYDQSKKAAQPEQAAAFLDQARLFLEQVKRVDSGLLEKSSADPVWDQLGLRDNRELADLLPRRVKPESMQQPQEDVGRAQPADPVQEG